MPKDMEILRDIWKVIDPSSSIGKESKLTQETRLRHRHEERKRIDRLKANRIAEINRLVANGQRIPKRLTHLQNEAAVERARQRAAGVGT